MQYYRLKWSCAAATGPKLPDDNYKGRQVEREISFIRLVTNDLYFHNKTLAGTISGQM